MPNKINRLVSVAPMLDCTDRHERFFLRLIAPDVLLYSEMITVGALMHGDYRKFLEFDPAEQPVALQLGGSEPDKLAYCAGLAEEWGYAEINLNVGCPSERVKSGHFGACLMLEPKRVAECIAAMRARVNIPVTIKCRIGVDQQDSYEQLVHFIATIAAVGCEVFIIHARKAWLHGLSPKQNREIPPLRYDIVQKVKQDFPQLTIVVNGGIQSLSQVEQLLQWADGVMIGREAYANPYFLAVIEQGVFGRKTKSREEVMAAYFPYIEKQLNNQVKLSSLTRHILGLFQGEKGAKMWRRHLSENAYKVTSDSKIIKEALLYVRPANETI